MISPSTLTGWVTRIHESLEETGIPVSRGVSWMQNNLYLLNAALDTGFYTNSSGYIDPDMTQNESGLYEQMYICSYYTRKGNAALGAYAYDWTEIAGDKQGTFRRVSKNEIAKTYQQYAKECKSQLEELIQWVEEQDIILLGQVLYNERPSLSDEGLQNYNECYHSCYPPSGYATHSTVWI